MKETEVECEGGRGMVGKREKQSVRGRENVKDEGECKEGQDRARQVGGWEVWQLQIGDNRAL